MTGPKRFLWLALATAMLTPASAKAKGKGRRYSVAPPEPRQGQARRAQARVPQDLPPTPSPNGRHVVQVSRGAVFVDGRRVHPARGDVYLLSAPQWRKDGRALAWLERCQGQVRLVVLPELGPEAEPMPWVLPALPSGDQVFWAGQNRIVVGPALLAPRAVASWSS